MNKILLVGDSMLDVAYRGLATRISPEAPVPILERYTRSEHPGGAANVAKNIVAMGGYCHFVSCAGIDSSGVSLRRACGANTTWIHSPGTTTKTRFFASSQMLLRMDENFDAEEPETSLMYEKAAEELDSASLLVISDYGRGVGRIAPSLIRMARNKHVSVLVDPKGSWRKYSGATWIKANKAESEEALAESGTNSVAGVAASLDVGAVIVTNGNAPAVCYWNNRVPQRIDTHAVSVEDVTGAGDSFLAAMAVSLMSGANAWDAMSYAAAAGAAAVMNRGTTVVTKEMIANVKRTNS